ncbi:MAG: hypothetical protein JWS10_240 [Cypionkella sp.]|nr:hypothetical protein [Cypionkella sp.]
MGETPCLSFAHLGGLGNGGWRGALRIAQHRAPLWDEGSGKIGWGLPSEAGVESFRVIVDAPGGERDAGVIQGNRVSFRSSSRSRPLKLSMKAFWVGLPGAI